MRTQTNNKTGSPLNGTHSPFLVLLCQVVGLFFLLGGIAYAQDLKASWYSVESLKKEGTWKHSKGVMANGKMFKDEEATCATRIYPLGTRIKVTNVHTGESVIVVVTDRISRRFGTTRIDLSKSSFEKIASLKEGLVPITVEVL